MNKLAYYSITETLDMKLDMKGMDKDKEVLPYKEQHLHIYTNWCLASKIYGSLETF